MTRHPFILPAMELGDEPIKVTMWLAKQDQTVFRGDPIVEVAGGSVVVDLPCPHDGRLVEILIGIDEPAQEGQTLAMIESDAEEYAS